MAALSSLAMVSAFLDHYAMAKKKICPDLGPGVIFWCNDCYCAEWLPFHCCFSRETNSDDYQFNSAEPLSKTTFNKKQDAMQVYNQSSKDFLFLIAKSNIFVTTPRDGSCCIHESSVVLEQDNALL